MPLLGEVCKRYCGRVFLGEVSVQTSFARLSGTRDLSLLRDSLLVTLGGESNRF